MPTYPTLIEASLSHGVAGEKVAVLQNLVKKSGIIQTAATTASNQKLFHKTLSITDLPTGGIRNINEFVSGTVPAGPVS